MILVKCLKADREALASLKVNPSIIKNDGIDYLNKRVKKPWGHEIERYRDDKVSVGWLHIHSENQTSLHCHTGKTTFLMIVGGVAQLDTLNGSFEIGAGELVIIEKGAFHQIVSNSQPVVLYEFEFPPNKRDVVRLKDAYSRGQGYERVERA